MVNTKPFEDALFRKVRDLLLSSRKAVVQGVNSLQVLTNFEIGRYIFEHEQQGESRANYGKELIKNLSEQLTSEFGRGFSKSNLEYMRRFFLAYRDRLPIAQSDIGQFTGNTARRPMNEYSPWFCLRRARRGSFEAEVFDFKPRRKGR